MEFFEDLGGGVAVPRAILTIKKENSQEVNFRTDLVLIESPRRLRVGDIVEIGRRQRFSRTIKFVR